ncbi:restriction endonuclease subunit S [Methylobacterium cerastii]|uniref:restriction endonuclease subunit S n=1 Tax=Methylobacterium cerastii TaxID=932741 RepID=UPI001EE37CED|nr:restriction endonuclease subunit S [Methylobacterium cerastii]
MGDIAQSIDYGLTASAISENTGNKFLRITDIQDGAVDWSSVPFCDAAEAKLRSAILNDGDIVFARTGATTGKSFLIKDPPQGAVFASYLIRVKPSRSVDASFLAHFFQSSKYWGQIRLKTQGAAQGGVNATSLSGLEIPLPPLDEQQRIAAILDKADALRRKRKRALELLGGLTQSVFLEMFGNPITNSMGWPTATLGSICDVRDGTHESPKYVADGFPLLTSKNFSNGKIDFDGAKFISENDYININRRSKVHKNDIVMPMIGTIGSPVLINREPNFAIKNVALFKFQKSKMVPEFVHALLAGPLLLKKISDASRGGTQKFLSLGDLRSLVVPLPPRHLQESFKKVDACNINLIINLDIEQLSLNELFISLQRRAFSGQL